MTGEAKTDARTAATAMKPLFLFGIFGISVPSLDLLFSLRGFGPALSIKIYHLSIIPRNAFIYMINAHITSAFPRIQQHLQELRRRWREDAATAANDADGSGNL